MKRLLIVFIILGLAFTAMATSQTDDETTTLNINIEEICWLAIDDSDADERTWSISEADLMSDDGTGGADNAVLSTESNNITNDGDPTDFAVFATDDVPTGTGDADHTAYGMRVMIDSNDTAGCVLQLKANGGEFLGSTDTDDIPIEACTWWTHDGEHNGVDAHPLDGTHNGNNDGTGVATYAARNTLTTVDQTMFTTDEEGSNVTTLNFALQLYTMDAFASDYTQTITITATNQ
ncbi:hypothetical protein ACFL4D_02400 [Candidatus Margulisiibacteriota bacterium]